MNAHRRSSSLPVAALAGLAAALTLAADSPEDPLVKLRSEWRARVEKDTRALREKYVASLEKLEAELAGGGDYAGAARARRERRRVAEDLRSAGSEPAPAQPAEATVSAPVELPAKAAAASGGVVFNESLGALTGWGAVGAAARWLLPAGLKAGGYDVELTWSCAPEGGGEVLIKEDRYTLRRTVKPTNALEDYKTEVVGTLRVVANSHTLDISAAAVKAPGLFQLKSVRLVPAPGSP